MFCKIADFVIEIRNKGMNFQKLEDFCGCSEKKSDMVIKITKDEALSEKAI